MVKIEETVNRVLKVYSKFIDKEDIDSANKYLLACIESLIYEYKANEISGEELRKIAEELRYKIIDGPNYLNPYIMEILGILEEEVSENSINEALSRISALHREERLDRLEV